MYVLISSLSLACVLFWLLLNCPINILILYNLKVEPTLVYVKKTYRYTPKLA